MSVNIEREIVNRKQPEKQKVTPDMNIPVFCSRDRIKLLFQAVVRRFTGKINLLWYVFNAFKYIEMYSLRSADCKPVEEKK